MPITKQKFTLILSLLMVLFSFIFSPAPAQARGLVPCGGYANDQGTVREPPCNIEFAFAMVAMVTNWLIMVAGIYAVFQIVSAGFWLVITMGNEESITKYRKMLTEAVVGFVFVMMAFILINTVVNYILLNGNPALRIDITNPFNYLNKKAINK